MKFSKSILIFLFFSSVSGAFFYALHRTNGNVFKSLQFALYWLAIKTGLIGANLPLKLDQDQPTQQLVSSVNKLESPGYHPYVSVYDDYRPSGLLMDSIERSSLTPQYSYSRDVINELRAGNRRVREAAWFLITIWMLQHQGVGFQPVRPIARPPHVEAAHNLLFGKPKSDGQSRLHLSNSKEVSTNVVPTQTQMSGFLKNGEVDLHKCLDELNRRASEIGCTDFQCSLERFKALATENGKLTSTTAREAITILQGEMQGYFRNARREHYGLNVRGPDFVVEGLGNFQHVTHVEVKNPVGSAIKIANGQKGSIAKQGKKIGAKIVYQQKYWSNTTETSELENLNPTASLPQAPNNVLAVVDNSSQKAFMEASILKGLQNNTNIIFLNNN